LEGLSKVIERLDARIDDGEQYSRRMCLRFNGVFLPAESGKDHCAERVYDILKGMGVDLPENAIDRAHRIGRISEQGKQQIIVRFKSFRERTLVYKNRKKCKKASIFLDVTKKRLALLSWAKEAIKNKTGMYFALPDINCNIGIRMKGGNFVFFNNEQEFIAKTARFS